MDVQTDGQNPYSFKPAYTLKVQAFFKSKESMFSRILCCIKNTTYNLISRGINVGHLNINRKGIYTLLFHLKKKKKEIGIIPYSPDQKPQNIPLQHQESIKHSVHLHILHFSLVSLIWYKIAFPVLLVHFSQITILDCGSTISQQSEVTLRQTTPRFLQLNPVQQNRKRIRKQGSFLMH